MASENEVYDSKDTDVPVTEGTNFKNYRTPTVTSETTFPPVPTSIREKQGFAATLWARTPLPNITPRAAPVSLTPASDPKPNDDRVFSPKRAFWTKEDWQTRVSHGEVTTNRNGIPYTVGQQGVLRDTMDMLKMHPDTPSAEEFGSMGPGEQGRTIKKFLGAKSLRIFIRNMNVASSANSAELMASGFSPAVSRTRLQDIWLQRIAAGAGAARAHPEGFKGFLETRNRAGQASSSRPLFTEGSSTNPTSASAHLDVSEDQFFQLLNDYYRSSPANSGDPGDAPGDSRQHGMARENTDLRAMVHQLEQAANRQSYANKMNHIKVLERPQEMSVYNARQADYRETLTRNPDDPPMFAAPQIKESPAVPLSIAHLFQDLMRIISANEVLLRSFEKEFKHFVIAQSLTSKGPATAENKELAEQLVARMIKLKSENEELGKLIGCGLRTSMRVTLREEELNEMRKVIKDLQEQIKNTRVDSMAELAPGDLKEMNNENQKLREEVGHLEIQNVRLEERQEEKHVELREKIDSLEARNFELQEQLRDVWANIARSGL
ncbi:hypothetical protein Q9L58_005752 [Maublancomyces gigas]|uniref:Uncharacterized protein n=1 Tax=Discina gigas TaxID=1032678 RepID=A0ABR3GH62_9PEZI